MKAILFGTFLAFGLRVLAHPLPENPQWLTYPGGDGPGKGKHIILIAARVFHSTMGSASDLKSAGLRRLIINATYWGLGLESAIMVTRSVEVVGDYQPLGSGFDYQRLGVVPKPVSACK